MERMPPPSSIAIDATREIPPGPIEILPRSAAQTVRVSELTRTNAGVSGKDSGDPKDSPGSHQARLPAQDHLHRRSRGAGRPLNECRLTTPNAVPAYLGVSLADASFAVLAAREGTRRIATFDAAFPGRATGRRRGRIHDPPVRRVGLVPRAVASSSSPSPRCG